MIDEETEDEDDASSPSSPATASGAATSAVDDLSPSYQVLPSRTGGFGLFATRPIPQGTLVLAETPLLTQPLSPTRTNSTILNVLAQRTREEQCAFFALFNAHKTNRPGRPVLLPALGIFETNALPCGATLSSASGDGADAKKAGKASHASTDGGREGIFLRAARLNHSCRPNVWRTWDVSSQEMTFRALRDITQGEELYMNYADVDILGTREERAVEIEEAFGFGCACEVCVLEGKEGKESDRRRADIKRLFEEIGTCSKEPTLGLRKVRIAMRLLKEEQLMHYEASFCFDAFQFCVMVSDFVNAKAWVKKAWEASCDTMGPESPAARTFKLYWANPRAHPLAGTLPHMTLSGPGEDVKVDETTSGHAARAS
ncbi:SET domain-containing protein [Ganoderma leucocontextum]|nr:SET domain-containing protein [Ganoderma leucocontextum]